MTSFNIHRCQRLAPTDVCKTRGCNYSFWAPDDERCHSKHVEQLINIGIINSSTQLHLVGYFCMIYTMMHGSTYIKHQPHVTSTLWWSRKVCPWNSREIFN